MSEAIIDQTIICPTLAANHCQWSRRSWLSAVVDSLPLRPLEFGTDAGGELEETRREGIIASTDSSCLARQNVASCHLGRLLDPSPHELFIAAIPVVATECVCSGWK